MPYILRRKTASREGERELKEADLLALTNFIRNKKLHVIAIGGESREATMIQQDLQEVIKKLGEEEQFPALAV